MAVPKGVIKSNGVVIFARNSLDNIVLSVTDSATYIASGGKIKKDYLPDASGLNNFVTDVKNAASTYVNSANVIPTSAVNGLTTSISTAATNAASTYVNSSGVIPTSAVNGLTTAINNGASSFVQSSGVIPASAITGTVASATNATSASVYGGTVSYAVNAGTATTIPDFVTSAKNAASTYVNSENVIPTSAVNGLSSALLDFVTCVIIEDE